MPIVLIAWTDGQTDGQADGQKDGQIDRHYVFNKIDVAGICKASTQVRPLKHNTTSSIFYLHLK